MSKPTPEELELLVLDIKHWGPSERAVLFRYNDDRIVCGEIINTYLKPSEGFEADILVKDGPTCYQGTAYAGWCKMGKEKREYKFVNEPPEITALKSKIKQKKAAKALAEIKKEAGEDDDDGFASDLDATEKVSAVGRERERNGRVSAVKESRLSKDTGGKNK